MQSLHSTQAREQKVWQQRMARGSNWHLGGDGMTSMTSVSSSHSNNQPQLYSMVSGSKCVWGWFGFVCLRLGLVWSDRCCFWGVCFCLFVCLFVVAVFVYLFVCFALFWFGFFRGGGGSCLNVCFSFIAVGFVKFGLFFSFLFFFFFFSLAGEGGGELLVWFGLIWIWLGWFDLICIVLFCFVLFYIVLFLPCNDSSCLLTD